MVLASTTVGRPSLLGGGVGGVDLALVVAAARQGPEVVVVEVGDEGPEPGVGPEEALADLGAVDGGEPLELAVDHGVERVDQQPVDVAGQQVVPRPAPHDLEHPFQPAPRNTPSSSWMILPLPRTGPSRRCRLQLTTQTRLSSRSRPASEMAPSVSGSSVSPSPTKHQTRLPRCRRGPGRGGSG
jgi:hypothetical protein